VDGLLGSARAGDRQVSYLHLDGLTRRFGGEAGVFGLSLAVEQGGILALLGPSGSGKTTTLRMLGGFERPDAGRIAIGGEDVTALRPELRNVGMVFQHYALFPHLDVGQNVAFGLESRGVPAPEVARRVREALVLVDLAGFERRPVAALSGGQQQRVALARALAPEPRVLLLDEPLSNLDPALRERTRRELRALIRRVGITTVIVTHEQEDAFDLADLVAVLDRGRLEQLGSPEELYLHPATPFVGGFIGRSSWIRGQVAPADGMVSVEGARWRLAGAARPKTPDVLLLLRPEALAFVPPGPRGLAATVTDRRYAGASTYYLVQTVAGVTIEVSAGREAAVVGESVFVAPAADPAGPETGVHLFPAEGG
jgi:ABC-type Fe3+/spermidine/putrescine transport system ATPase subunit